ncbi:hypothetical protein Tco_1358938, partial [Tanacetum coccineum]
VPFNFEPEPCNNQDFSDNYEPYDLQNECTICGDLHDDSQCTQLWCDHGEPICENYGGYHMDYQCTQAEEIERQRESKERNRVHEETMQMLREMIKIQEEKRIFEEAARQEEEKRIAKEKEAAELEARVLQYRRKIYSSSFYSFKKITN